MHRVEPILPQAGFSQAGSSKVRSAGGVISRACALLLLIAPIAGCSTLDSLNPFGGEKYETKLLADAPAAQRLRGRLEEIRRA